MEVHNACTKTCSLFTLERQNDCRKKSIRNIVVLRKRTHGRCTLLRAQTGGWANICNIAAFYHEKAPIFTLSQPTTGYCKPTHPPSTSLIQFSVCISLASSPRPAQNWGEDLVTLANYLVCAESAYYVTITCLFVIMSRNVVASYC